MKKQEHRIKIVGEFLSNIPSYSTEMIMSIPREMQDDGGVVIMKYNVFIRKFWKLINDISNK